MYFHGFWVSILISRCARRTLAKHEINKVFSPTASSCGERESERLHNIASRLHEQLDHIIEVNFHISACNR